MPGKHCLEDCAWHSQPLAVTGQPAVLQPPSCFREPANPRLSAVNCRPFLVNCQLSSAQVITVAEVPTTVGWHLPSTMHTVPSGSLLHPWARVPVRTSMVDSEARWAEPCPENMVHCCFFPLSIFFEGAS